MNSLAKNLLVKAVQEGIKIAANPDQREELERQRRVYIGAAKMAVRAEVIAKGKGYSLKEDFVTLHGMESNDSVPARYFDGHDSELAALRASDDGLCEIDMAHQEQHPEQHVPKGQTNLLTSISISSGDHAVTLTKEDGDNIRAALQAHKAAKPKRDGKKAPAPQPDPEEALAKEREEWLPQPAEAG